MDCNKLSMPTGKCSENKCNFDSLANKALSGDNIE